MEEEQDFVKVLSVEKGGREKKIKNILYKPFAYVGIVKKKKKSKTQKKN
jgi:hypothetical protein